MASPVITCAGCLNAIEGEQYLRCCQCKSAYDLQCTSMSENQFLTLSKERKATWTCQFCACNKPKKDNTNTPVRAALKDVEYVPTGPNVSIDASLNLNQSLTEPYKNITVRKPKTSNDSTMQYRDIGNDACCGLDSIRAVIREELQFAISERLTKVISNSIAEQLATIMQSVTDLKARVEVLESQVKVVSTVKLSNASAQTETSNKWSNRSLPAAAMADNQKKNKSRLNQVAATLSEASLSETLFRTEGERATDTRNASSSTESTSKSGSGGSSDDNITSEKSPFAVAPNIAASTQSATNSLETMENRKTRDCSVSNDGWKEVQSKRARRSIVSMVRGSAAPGSTTLQASERTTYLHLFYVMQGTTEEEVKLHLNKISGCEGVCSVLSLKARGNYASFKLGVPPKLVDRVLACENWAQDICVKPWRDNFRRQSAKM